MSIFESFTPDQEELEALRAKVEELTALLTSESSPRGLAIQLAAANDKVEELTHTLVGWTDSAKYFRAESMYYRGLIAKAAKFIGLPMYTADDQGVHHEPLNAKLPECVESLVNQLAAMTKERVK